jgi:hypothetical protein
MLHLHDVETLWIYAYVARLHYRLPTKLWYAVLVSLIENQAAKLTIVLTAQETLLLP